MPTGRVGWVPQPAQAPVPLLVPSVQRLAHWALAPLLQLPPLTVR